MGHDHDHEYGDHDHEAEAVEVATPVYRSGVFWTWVECGVCGLRLSSAQLDSVL